MKQAACVWYGNRTERSSNARISMSSLSFSVCLQATFPVSMTRSAVIERTYWTSYSSVRAFVSLYCHNANKKYLADSSLDLLKLLKACETSQRPIRTMSMQTVNDTDSARLYAYLQISCPIFQAPFCCKYEYCVASRQICFKATRLSYVSRKMNCIWAER